VPEGLGSRFAFEAAFLILLAVVAGLADLRPLLIVAVMAGAWAIVSAIEWLAWRAGPRPFMPVAPAPAKELEGDEGILVPEELQQEPLTTVLPPAESGPAADAGRE
jgi:hypothetical protein